MKVLIFVGIVLISQLCSSTPYTNKVATDPQNVVQDQGVIPGAARTDAYLNALQGKRIGLVVNQTSRIGEQHLVDSLLSLGIGIDVIFAPEHGFRGTADAGDKIADGKDAHTGLPVLSLYGKQRKPSPEVLGNLDLVIFDIQDVGARFYTYISTMHLVMEACAQNQVPFMVLDRPNPNGHYIDGPILDMDYQSFVGMHQIPVAHGLTVGELAKMINGEGWLEGGIKADLTVIPVSNYDHQTRYDLPVITSPNLPNMRSVYLYPSLCFFEGTSVSVGRGTDRQFQLAGHPDYPDQSFSFTPVPMPGAQHPKHNGKKCYGQDLTKLSTDELWEKKQLDLSWLVDFYQQLEDKDNYFAKTLFIDRLAGGDHLRKAIIAGKSAEEIRADWQEGLTAYRKMRAPYLLYPDADQ